MIGNLTNPPGRPILTGSTLWGVYDVFADAAKDALEQLEPGKIMIHSSFYRI